MKEYIKATATKAAQVFGIHGVTFRELAKAANIKASSVFYHFGSKDKLLAEIATDYKNAFLERLDEIDSRQKASLEKLKALVEIFEEPYLKGNTFCLCGMLAAELHALNDETIDILRSYFNQIEKWISLVLTQDNKLTSKEVKMYSKIIIASLEGGLMIDRVEGKLMHLVALKDWLKILLK